MTKLRTPSTHNVLRAYKNTDNNGKQLLRDLYGENIGDVDITDVVKSFEDACGLLGIDTALPDVSMLPKKDRKSITAYYKLVVIARALNAGWEPDWEPGNSDDKYWLWWDMTRAGFGYAFSSLAPSYSYAYIGSRLCFHEKRLAKYCAEEFVQLWRDYMLIEQ